MFNDIILYFQIIFRINKLKFNLEKYNYRACEIPSINFLKYDFILKKRFF